MNLGGPNGSQKRIGKLQKREDMIERAEGTKILKDKGVLAAIKCMITNTLKLFLN